MDNGPLYFEIQASNIQKAINFYKEVFNWKFIKAEEITTIEYWRIETGGCRGGLLKRPIETPPSHYGTNSYVCSMKVNNFDETAEKILSLAGQVAMPKFAIPNLCWQGYFIDTEGNTFGIYQPDPNAK